MVIVYPVAEVTPGEFPYRLGSGRLDKPWSIRQYHPDQQVIGSTALPSATSWSFFSANWLWFGRQGFCYVFLSATSEHQNKGREIPFPPLPLPCFFLIFPIDNCSSLANFEFFSAIKGRSYFARTSFYPVSRRVKNQYLRAWWIVNQMQRGPLMLRKPPHENLKAQLGSQNISGWQENP